MCCYLHEHSNEYVQCDFAAWTMHFLMMSKRPTNAMYWCLIYFYIFRHFKMPSSGSPIWTCWMVPNVVKSREGWELYIVTDGVMVSMLLGEGAQCHNIQLPFFSAFRDIGHYLSMFITDSLMMAFWNAETCRSVLSTNTLNEWCKFWSFTHHTQCGCVIACERLYPNYMC
jgi:hypothetical protein